MEKKLEAKKFESITLLPSLGYRFREQTYSLVIKSETEKLKINIFEIDKFRKEKSSCKIFLQEKFQEQKKLKQKILR